MTRSHSGDDDETATPTTGFASTTAGATTLTTTRNDPLAGCPDRLVVQLDGLPKAEHGALFNVLADGPEIDPSGLTISGPIVVDGVDQEHTLELRTGVPGVNFSTVETVLHTDPTVLLGYTATDNQIADFATHPTVGVISLLEKSATAIMWNRVTAPQAVGLTDLGPLAGPIRVTSGASFGPWLSGLINHPVESDLEGWISIANDPGLLAQSGNATIDPYRFATDATSPVDVGYQLLHDAGWQPAAGVLAVRADQVDSNAACLSAIVPLLQRSQRSFEANPQPALARIVDSVVRLAQFYAYSQVEADNAVSVMRAQGIFGLDTSTAVGRFEDARVRLFEDTYRFTAATAGVLLPEKGPTAPFTNQFIDPSITRAGA